MMSQTDSISIYQAPAHNIIPDFQAWDHTMNGFSCDNASGSESAANLGTYGTTIDPSVLTAHNGYNDAAGETYYSADVGVETTRQDIYLPNLSNYD
jgi:hypothetical protein